VRYAADDDEEEESEYRFLLHFDGRGSGAETLQRGLEAAVPGSHWRVQQVPGGSDDETKQASGGGGGPVGDIVELVRPVLDTGSIADWFTIGLVLKAAYDHFIERLGRDDQRREPLPNEHSAIAFAAQALSKRARSTNPAPAFVTTMRSRHADQPSGHEAHWGAADGFVVGFRSPEMLWVVALDVHCMILGVTKLRLPAVLSGRWDS